jgi:hypothetical protein
MSWLGKLTGQGGTAVAEAIPEVEATPEVKSGPSLIILVNDASGRVSFKAHVFKDIESATNWVRCLFPGEAGDGMTAFWAMTEDPNGAQSVTNAEPLVLIRDTLRDGVVYLFSFTDMAAAQKFLRDEVERGTKLSAMMLYWAVAIKKETDRWGNTVLTPSTPFGEAAPEDPDDVADVGTDGWVVQQDPPPADVIIKEPAGDARALLKEALNAYTGVADENIDTANETFALSSWAERAGRRPASNVDDDTPLGDERIAASDSAFGPVSSATIDTIAEVVAQVAASSEAVDEPAPAEQGPHVEIDEVAEEVASFVEAAPDKAEAEVITEASAVVQEALDNAEQVLVEATAVVDQALETEAEDQAAATADDRLDTASEALVELRASSEETPEVTVQAALADEALDMSDESTVEATVVAEEAVEPAEEIAVIEAGAVVDEAVEVTAEAGDSVEETEDQERDGVATLPTNGNGHAPLYTEELIVQANGHEANGHSHDVTGLNGEGATPSYEGVNGRGHAADPVPAPTNTLAEAHSDGASNGQLDKAAEARIGLHLESKALKVRRWEIKDGPFEGFKSPPGRF